MSPQFADIDGDGRADLFSGTFTGTVLYAPGGADGGFGAPRALLDERGHPLGLGTIYDAETRVFTDRYAAERVVGHLYSAVPVDWDADGDLDLVLGEKGGRILLTENTGSAEEPRYAARPQRILSGRKSIWVESGSSQPAVADWDGDGLFDLVVGAADGSVTLWPNVGEAGAPLFGPPVVLLDAAPSPPDPTRPAQHANPYVADIDGDGTPELFVGDHRSLSDGETTSTKAFVWMFRQVRED